VSKRGQPDPDAEWWLAFQEARAAFARAYERRPPTRLDRAVALLLEEDAPW